MRYDFDSRGFVRISVSPDPDPDEEIESYLGMLSDPRFHPGIAILLDNRARRGEGDSEHVRRMAGLARKSSERLEGCRCAIVVSNDVEFGMARMYELMASGDPLTVRVFRDMEEAESWLTCHDEEED